MSESCTGTAHTTQSRSTTLSPESWLRSTKTGSMFFYRASVGGRFRLGRFPSRGVTPNQVYERAALTGIEYYWERITRVFKRRR